MYRYIYSGLCFLLSASIPAVSAQSTGKPFFKISSSDGYGLSSNLVTSIIQDQKGYLWVGTANGLQRFDGNKFMWPQNLGSLPQPLPEGQVNQLVKAEGGKFWILMQDPAEIGLFDPATLAYRKIPLQPAQKFPARAEYKLWTDSHGQTYLHVLRHPKILVYDTAKGVFNENTPLNQLPEGWMPGLNMAEDKARNRYWIVTGKGLCVYDKASKTMWSELYNPLKLDLLSDNSPYRIPSEIYIDKQKRLWYFHWTTQQNFFCYDASSGKPLNETAGLSGTGERYAEMRHFFETKDGQLWIYGPGGLYARSKGSTTFEFFGSGPSNYFSIEYDAINQVYEDNAGVIWIASNRGLYYQNPRLAEVKNITLSTKPGDLEITDAIQLTNGDYWLSTWGKGIIVLDSGFNRKPLELHQHYKGPPGEKLAYKQCWSLLQHSSGLVFAGCQSGRLLLHHPRLGTTTFLNPPAMENHTIRYMAEGAEGQVWFGTQGGGVIRYHSGQFTKVFQLPSPTIIYKLLYDAKRSWLWLATFENGLYAINTATGKIMAHYYNTPDGKGLGGNTVKDMEIASDTTLYVAAGGALNLVNINSGKISVLSLKDGLPSKSISRLRLDSKGYLWITTQSGLCHYDPRQGRFSSFGKNDGILNAEIANACDLLDRNQNLIFAGPNTLLFFHPNIFYDSPRPPAPVITDFRLLDAYLPVDSLLRLGTIQLSPHSNSFSIYFSTLSYANRGQFAYYYKLEGADKEWVKADGSQSATYRLLPAGRYRFMVRAVNIDGISSAAITEMYLIVRPAFYRTGWFISLLLMIAAMVGYGIHRLNVKKLLAVEKIRARVSRDLHDDMGSTLSTINILSSMAKAKLHTDNLKTAEYLSKISDNSQRMMEAMDDIVWAIKPDNDTMQKLVARMREFSTSVLDAKDIVLKFYAEEQVMDCKPDMEARRDLFLLFKEAVNNAAKYSGATEVQISIAQQTNKLSLTVQDNGKGFDVKKADGGNGLGNMQRRAAALHGQLHIESEAGKGTVISLKVPLTNMM